MATFDEIESKLEKLIRSQYGDDAIDTIRRVMAQELLPITRRFKLILVKGKRIEN